MTRRQNKEQCVARITIQTHHTKIFKVSAKWGEKSLSTQNALNQNISEARRGGNKNSEYKLNNRDQNICYEDVVVVDQKLDICDICYFGFWVAVHSNGAPLISFTRKRNVIR